MSIMIENLLVVQHRKHTYHCGWLKGLENRKRGGLKEENILIRRKLSLIEGSERKGNFRKNRKCSSSGKSASGGSMSINVRKQK